MELTYFSALNFDPCIDRYISVYGRLRVAVYTRLYVSVYMPTAYMSLYIAASVPPCRGMSSQLGDQQ